MKNKDIINMIAKSSEDKQANNIVALDMQDISSIADYFIICDASNERQVQTVARSIKETLEESEIDIKRMEGFEQGRWVLIDIGDVICHVFHIDERSYYNLERLWGDADRIKLDILQKG